MGNASSKSDRKRGVGFGAVARSPSRSGSGGSNSGNCELDAMDETDVERSSDVQLEGSVALKLEPASPRFVKGSWSSGKTSSFRRDPRQRLANVASKLGLVSFEGHQDDEILGSFLNKSDDSGRLRSFHNLMHQESEGALRLDAPRPGSWVSSLIRHVSHSSLQSERSAGQDSIDADADAVSLGSEVLNKSIFHNAVGSSQLLHDIDEHFCSELFDAAVEIRLKRDDIIFRPNQTGALMFVIVQGEIETVRRRRIHANERKVYKTGDVICEDAMLENLVHSETATVISDAASLLALHRVEFQLIALKMSIERPPEEATRAFFDHLYVMQPFSAVQRDHLFSKTESLMFHQKEEIVAAGSSFDGLFVIEAGEVVFESREGHPFKWLQKGDIFGEPVFFPGLRSSFLGFRVVARSIEVRVAKLPHTDVEEVLKGDSRSVSQLLHNFFKQGLLIHNSLFSHLSGVDISALAEKISSVKLHSGQVLENKENLFIVLDGVLVLYEDGKVIASVGHGECFGNAKMLMDEEVLKTKLMGTSFYPSKLDLVARSGGETICGVISADVVVGLGFKPLRKMKKLKQVASSATERALKILDGLERLEIIESFHRDDLILIRRVFNGPQSKIYFAKHQPTNQVLVVKELAGIQMGATEKARLAESITCSALAEVTFLRELADFKVVPRIVGFEDSVKTTSIAMEPMIGGDLESFLRENGTPGLGIDVFRFFSACLVNGLKILFEKGILHRDIKPPNLMIDAIGYVRLVDFGISKGSMTSENSRTGTLCGTSKYMAPEMAKLILGKGEGYGLHADWWALGTTMFELGFGFNPFEKASRHGNNIEEVEELPRDPSIHIILHRILGFAESYAKVLKMSALDEDFDIDLLPPNFHILKSLQEEWKSVADLILKLLHPSCFSRLGATGHGPRKVMEHPFFNSISFANISERTFPAPNMPSVPKFLLKESHSNPRRRPMLQRKLERQEAEYSSFKGSNRDLEKEVVQRLDLGKLFDSQRARSESGINKGSERRKIVAKLLSQN